MSRCQTVSTYDYLGEGHAGRNDYGENLYWAWTFEQVQSTAAQAIEAWRDISQQNSLGNNDQDKLYSALIRYDESKDYAYNNPDISLSTGQFSQVLWAGSSSVGCARCSGPFNGGFETYVVCNYYPSDSQGQFQFNVLRLWQRSDIVNKDIVNPL